jgi:HNH endonuclease
VARLARRFPDILVEIYEGRLHLTAVQMLAPHLRSGNADDLLVEARNKTKTELELMLARRFPKPDEPDRLEAIGSPSAALISEFLSGPAREHALEHVQATMPDRVCYGHLETPLSEVAGQHAPEHVEASAAEPVLAATTRQHALEHVAAPALRGRVTPLSPGRYRFGGTWDQEGCDLYREVRDLMSHEVPSGELSLVLIGSLRIARAELLRRQFGLEIDHIEPVARGGEATVENLRLLCRAHNQYAAEREFGAEFMSRKLDEARRARRETRAAKQRPPAPSGIACAEAAYFGRP